MGPPQLVAAEGAVVLNLGLCEVLVISPKSPVTVLVNPPGATVTLDPL